MGLKARLRSYCTKRANNGVNLVTSRKINTRLARPIGKKYSAKWARGFTNENNREHAQGIVKVHFRKLESYIICFHIFTYIIYRLIKSF